MKTFALLSGKRRPIFDFFFRVPVGNVRVVRIVFSDYAITFLPNSKFSVFGCSSHSALCQLPTEGYRTMKMQPAGTISCQAWYSGPIILSGNWEPLIFRRRLGGGCSDVAERYLEEHSPELVRELQRKGINLLITHYFKGFGLQAEAEDIVQTRKLTRLCHQANIRVGAYIGDTLIPETFLTEEPDAASWYQIDAAGNAIQYGGTQSFRYKWCRTNPAFLIPFDNNG